MLVFELAQDSFLIEDREFLDKEIIPKLDATDSFAMILFARITSRCKRVLAEMRENYRHNQVVQARALEKPLTLDDLERRLAEIAQPRDIVALLRRVCASEGATGDLADSRSAETIDCALPDVEEADSVDSLVNARITHLR